MYNMTDYSEINVIANGDVRTLKEKGKSYGDSWRKRGGVGAFMMLARKWDRIEQQTTTEGYDIFRACYKTAENPEGLLDDIADLRAYLLLVEEHVRSHYRGGSQTASNELVAGGPTSSYVNQD